MSDDAEFAQLAEDLSPDDLRVVLGVFATDVKRLTTNLYAVAAANDLAGFRRVAHGLAGAAGAVGAKTLEMACRSAMARGETAPEPMTAVAATIDSLAQAAMAKLEDFVAGLDSANPEHE